MDQHSIDRQITSDSRNKDLFIAEPNRQRDEFLADDQQKEMILTDYEHFLVIQLLFNQQTPSNRNTSGRLALCMKTLAALGQLNPSRRTFLIRSLYEAGLIHCNTCMHRSCQSTTNLALNDSMGLALGHLPNDDVEVDDENKIVYSHLILEQTILRKASFRGVDLFGSVFGRVNLTLARLCQFESTTSSFDQALVHGTLFESTMLPNATFAGAVLRRAHFVSTQLNKSDWDAIESIDECQFLRSNLSRATFVGSPIRKTSFSDGHLFKANLRHTRIEKVRFSAMNMMKIDFTNAFLDRCTFHSVNMTYCQLVGTSFHETTFFNTNLTNCTGLTLEQIRQTRWMNSTVLSNGTLYTGIHS